jgi:hypothetical protein
MATAKTAVALVLCDVVSHGLKAGQLVEGSPDLIKALAADGSVDPHKDAVAYARGQGAAVQRSSIELSEQRDAAVKALQADVAQLQEAHDKAADDARPALAEQLAAKQAELAAALA